MDAQFDAEQPDRIRPLRRAPNIDPANASPDPELFIRQAFAEHPEKGYELLFRRYYAPLCSHAARFIYDRQAAEDVVIDVFSQFWQKRLDLSVTTSFRAYLFTIVRNRAFWHLRREFGRELPTDNLPDEDFTDALATPLQTLQFSELYITINDTIRSASAHSQKVFVMSRFEGKKNAQIAEELGLSVKTVEGHITKVLNLLRQVLRQDGLISVGLLLGGWLNAQGIDHLFRLIGIATNLNV
ncbi:RNA polymerase sigma-70 factor [Spirosoma montaniterrae]|uniref:RNA polymerase subunit sigma-24 n=1 Tax=Spirosoma montaniterrae TaxID=1178516 RepID=A0A1P9WRR5_9BACT|nr:RNA polymerase sigma-70 factor [Spirosoma montaniterrae]AQG78059.1 RNA polymerase subunit sigma-24 [Spirosoma montaniterrae]